MRSMRGAVLAQCLAPSRHPPPAVYKQQRTRPPLGPCVWRLMFESQLAELVLGILGPGAVLFNDQVRPGKALPTGRRPVVPGLPWYGPVCCSCP